MVKLWRLVSSFVKRYQWYNYLQLIYSENRLSFILRRRSLYLFGMCKWISTNKKTLVWCQLWVKKFSLITFNEIEDRFITKFGSIYIDNVCRWDTCLYLPLLITVNRHATVTIIGLIGNRSTGRTVTGSYDQPMTDCHRFIPYQSYLIGREKCRFEDLRTFGFCRR